MIDRATVVEAVRDTLDDLAGQCREEHAAIGARVADRLGLLEMPPPGPVVAPIEPPGPSVAPPPARVSRGVWIDDPPSLVLQAPYLERLRALPLDHVAVMVDSSSSTAWRWSPAHLEQLARALPAHRRVLTLWGRADREWVDALGSRLRAGLAALGTDAVEVDLEGSWRPAVRRGYPTMAEAGRALVDVLRGAARTVEVTTFPTHAEARTGAAVTPHADRLVLQVYSVRTLDGTVREWSDARFGPGHYQRRCIPAAREALPGVEVVAGLAAYDQAWPGRTWAEAMQAAYDGALESGSTECRWWSAKWLCRLDARSWSAPGLVALAG